MQIKKAYQQLVNTKKLTYDVAQQTAVNTLCDLTTELIIEEAVKKSWWYKFNKRHRSKGNIKGVYFHGRVGRGKTMLMDLFYQHLVIEKKQRIHFHRFMESVHQQLNEISKNSSKNQINRDDPLKNIAKRWAENVDVLCFDEFFISDIGDAMLISGLLKSLFKEGITLVTTSNCEPEDLYRNGLQRELFLPTISLLSQNCQIISINGDVDHRITSLNYGGKNSVKKLEAPTKGYRNYVYPSSKYSHYLKERFIELTLLNDIFAGVININHRVINFVARVDRIIYFDFYALCSGPRSQRDYISLADQFDTILLSNVPQFSGELIPAVFSGVEDSYQRKGVLMGQLRHLDDEARRFIALVDELYDQKVKLIVSAEVDIEHLYQGQQLAFEFARCRSRLFEMQQINY
ncbi:MAG: cell division protein ZapE [Colwellia sp.]|nr:cell division protein ZapE [Colwellia sp.]